MRVAFRAVPTRYRERRIRGLTPARLAIRHALGKARLAVVRAKRGIVLGADTLIYFRGRIIGKPRSHREAAKMIEKFSNRSHVVYTAIAPIDIETGRALTGFARTRVRFHHLDAPAIREYLSRINPLDKAGAYAIQDGRTIVHSIRGSYTNVMGLPAELLKKMLRHGERVFGG